jgi:hypothetical protein
MSTLTVPHKVICPNCKHVNTVEAEWYGADYRPGGPAWAWSAEEPTEAGGELCAECKHDLWPIIEKDDAAVDAEIEHLKDMAV